MAVIDKDSTILSEFELAFAINKWQQIQVALKDGYIEVSLTDNGPVRINVDQKIVGGIGLLLEGRIKAYFDNIHVRKITQAKQQKQ